jgi:hypothetical protein
MARVQIDEAKIARLMEVMEANIDAEVASERIVGIYIPGVTPPPKKVDRKAERTLFAELSMAEQVEVSRRCKLKARACYEAGDNHRKWLWGGW